MSGLFLPQFRRRQLSQLFLDEGQQLLCSMGISPAVVGITEARKRFRLMYSAWRFESTLERFTEVHCWIA